MRMYQLGFSEGIQPNTIRPISVDDVAYPDNNIAAMTVGIQDYWAYTSYDKYGFDAFQNVEIDYSMIKTKQKIVGFNTVDWFERLHFDMWYTYEAEDEERGYLKKPQAGTLVKALGIFFRDRLLWSDAHLFTLSPFIISQNFNHVDFITSEEDECPEFRPVYRDSVRYFVPFETYDGMLDFYEARDFNELKRHFVAL